MQNERIELAVSYNFNQNNKNLLARQGYLRQQHKLLSQFNYHCIIRV